MNKYADRDPLAELAALRQRLEKLEQLCKQQGQISSRDDDAESNYDIPPPYHLSLTAAKYGGRTKTIPQDVLVALCGGPTGCEVTLAMTRWYKGTETEGASRSVQFYYSKDDGHWRTSADSAGIDGDGATQHILSIWNVCYFTDGNLFELEQYRG